MNSKVSTLPPSCDYLPEQALQSAMQFAEGDNLKEVLIVGTGANGELFVRSSKMDRKSAFWLLEELRQYILYGESA